MSDATDPAPSAGPPAPSTALRIADLAGACVDARRLDDGSTELAIRTGHGITVTFRDSASVLRSLLDDCRVAVVLLADRDTRRA
ncbi:MAG: hypothetical protein ACLFXM_15270 [Acidimicrobiia bacterium]